LAIALSLEPDVLLLDEPTSALDPETCLLVENTILNRGGSCIWVTHDPAQAERVATRILTLRRLTDEESLDDFPQSFSMRDVNQTVTNDMVIQMEMVARNVNRSFSSTK
jgi:ATPase subunit of ABC transporter with duplicated ATPase domains